MIEAPGVGDAASAIPMPTRSSRGFAGRRVGQSFLSRVVALVTAFSTGTCAFLATYGKEREAPPDVGAAGARLVVESPHFVLRTDLMRDEASQALDRMERTLDFAVQFWNRVSRGKIDCYLVHDLGAWPKGSLPHPLARVLVRGVGGATLPAPVREGGRTSQRQAVIYASSQPGVLEHEVIHAYCLHNFGAMGPEWYKEGMAEMASYGEHGARGVRCPADRLAVIRRQGARPVGAVLTASENTQRIVDSLDAMWPKSRDRRGDDPLAIWTAEDARNVRRVRDDYVWSWALCHMLNHNANFARRFRVLGEELLTRREATFEEHFAAMQSELGFEYRFFLDHVDVGFRADLCAWDWKKRFKTLDDGTSVGGRILARRGWQPSGLITTAEQRYVYRAEGTWGVNSSGRRTTADGAAGGVGQLVGVVLHDFQLSAPFPLGTSGEFRAPCSGKLYLRCQDKWNELSDNHGEVLVRLAAGE